MNKLISIIIPFYNADKYIGRMLDSLLKQDLATDRYEIIIVDDGSTDESVELNAYIKRYSNIKYVRKGNAGPGAARNTGLEKAEGEYVFFCDSDDYVADNVLGSLYRIAHEHKLDMLFHGRVEIKENEEPFHRNRNFGDVKLYHSGKHYFASLSGYIKTGPTFYIIRRDFVNHNDLKFPQGMILEDTSFFIDAIMSAECVATVNVDVYYYVIYPHSLLHSKEKNWHSEKYIDTFFWFLNKLSSLINDIDGHAPHGFVENLWRLSDAKVYMLLFNSIKYLPFSKIYKYTKMLSRMDVYPMKHFKENTTSLSSCLIHNVLNKPFVFLPICLIVSIVPSSMKTKIFKCFTFVLRIFK